MNSTSRIARAVLLGLGALLFACGDSPTGPRTATVIVRLMTPATVASVTVEVSGPGLSPPVVVNVPVGGDSVAWDTLTVTAGSGRRFVVTAVDTAGVQTHRADTTITLVSGTNAPLVLRLDPLSSTLGITVTFGGVRLTVSDTATRVIAVGDTVRVTASALAASGEAVSADSLRWGSSNPAIFTVESGLLRPVRPGTATLAVSYRGASARVAVIVSATPPSNVPSAGLVAWYPLDGSAADGSGAGHHGILDGNPQFVNNRLGRATSAVSFVGETDRIRLQSLPVDLDSGARNTVSMWVRWSAFGSFDSGAYLMYWGDNKGGVYLVGASSGAALRIGLNAAAGCGETWGVANPVGFPGQWVHVVAVFNNGALNTGELYLNAERVVEVLDSCAGSAASYTSQAATSVSIGGWGQGDIRYVFQGQLDDIGIWNRALSAAEIAALYATP